MGILIYCNLVVLINWVSWRQLTIETSIFGIEFVAMNHSVLLEQEEYQSCQVWYFPHY